MDVERVKHVVCDLVVVLDDLDACGNHAQAVGFEGLPGAKHLHVDSLTAAPAPRQAMRVVTAGTMATYRSCAAFRWSWVQYFTDTDPVQSSIFKSAKPVPFLTSVMHPITRTCRGHRKMSAAHTQPSSARGAAQHAREHTLLNARPSTWKELSG